MPVAARACLRATVAVVFCVRSARCAVPSSGPSRLRRDGGRASDNAKGSSVLAVLLIDLGGAGGVQVCPFAAPAGGIAYSRRRAASVGQHGLRLLSERDCSHPRIAACARSSDSVALAVAGSRSPGSLTRSPAQEMLGLT